MRVESQVSDRVRDTDVVGHCTITERLAGNGQLLPRVWMWLKRHAERTRPPIEKCLQCLPDICTDIDTKRRASLTTSEPECGIETALTIEVQRIEPSRHG